MSTENSGGGILSDLMKGKYNLWIFVAVGVGVGYWLGKRSERAGLRSQMQSLQRNQQMSNMAHMGHVPMSGMGNMQGGRDSMGFEPLGNMGGTAQNSPCPDNTPAADQVPSEEFEFMG